MILKKDILIPAGTKLVRAPKSITFSENHMEIVVAFGANHSSSMFIDEETLREHSDIFSQAIGEDR